MTDISIGAVGTALIAGLVSLFGLVIGKEQKVSEFRQAWIDQLRRSLVSYLVNINSISDAVRIQRAEKKNNPSAIVPDYKILNEARNDIILRINHEEQSAKELLKAMSNFEKLAESNENLTPQNIRAAEQEFIKASKDLLKFEWNRVKRGEKTFYRTKYIVITSIVLTAAIFSYLLFRDGKPERKKVGNDFEVQLLQESSFQNTRRIH